MAGGPLERLSKVVDFEVFREDLEAALVRSDRAKGGRPPYDAVMMFKVLVLQTLYTLSDDATEYQLKDRLSFMRFCGLALHDAVPDAKTIWLYREQLTRAGALQRLFERFDAILRERGYLAMGGQIVDATVIEARRPRLSRREGDDQERRHPADWSKAKRAQVDRDGRWLVAQFQRAKPEESRCQRRPARQHRPGEGAGQVEHFFAAQKRRLVRQHEELAQGVAPPARRVTDRPTRLRDGSWSALDPANRSAGECRHSRRGGGAGARHRVCGSRSSRS